MRCRAGEGEEGQLWRARHAAPCVDHIDQSCTQVCPGDCISADLTIDRKLYINPDTCIDCGACEAACPNSAILRTEDLPSAWADFAWIDATWYSDPDAARAVVNESFQRPEAAGRWRVGA